jgi:hypothetical protein
LDAIKKASAEAEAKDLARIAAAADAGQWTAAAWRLERKYPQRWGAQRKELLDLKKRVEEMEEREHAWIIAHPET